MKLPVLFFFLLFYISANAVTDTLFYEKIVNTKIKKISINNINECWIICNNDSNDIIRIDSNLNIFNKTQELRTYTQSEFTGILTIKQNKAIIITKSDYAYYYDNGKILHLNEYFGITDDSLVSVSCSKKSGKIFIESTRNGFVSIDKSYTNYIKFTNNTTPDDKDNATDDDPEDFNFIFITPFVSFNNELTDYLIEKNNKKKTHIKNRHINAIKKKLEPCDILLKRENWYFTNNIIPGFWTHTGIYVGSLRKLDKYFKNLELLQGLKPSAYIRKHYNKIYRKLLQKRNPVIEAITSGVRISRLKKIAKVDYFAALRPDLSKEDKFLTLLKAFEFYMLPYDYGFDFSDNNAIVCSELIYKSFLPTTIKKGITFDLGTLLGKPFMYPSDIVKKFDRELETNETKLKFVLFYDCISSEKKAFKSTAEEFRKTWKRSRFDFLQK